MGEKRPQPTATLVKRLRRVAKWLDTAYFAYSPASARARADTCLQAAARLEELDAFTRCERLVVNEGRR